MATPEEPDIGETMQEMLPEIPESVFEEEEGAGTPEETMEVIVEKEVKIVTPDEAEEIIKEGGEVWTDGSKPVRIEDLEKQEEAVTGDTAAAADGRYCGCGRSRTGEAGKRKHSRRDMGVR